MTAPTETPAETLPTPETTPRTPEGAGSSQADPQTPQARPEPRDPEAVNRSREAASYRTRLRDTEAERDTLRERIDGYERREVESIARSLGAAVPADLWTLFNLDELRVDGQLDAEAVKARIATILRDRPTWREPIPDLGSGARPGPIGSRELGLSQLIKPGRR